MRNIVIIAHNVRSSHNVGALLRTAEGLGISSVLLTGYTPYPVSKIDTRLPHIAKKTDAKIAKTALGAEKHQRWEYVENIEDLILKLRKHGFTIAALEQTETSKVLTDYIVPDNIALIVGREVEGIEPEVIKLTDVVLEIPMFGKKESFNVAQSAAMAMFYCRFTINRL